MSVSSIDTERLTLRRHQLSDFAESFAMWSDPAVTRFIGGKPATEQQSWARLMNYAGHWALLGFGYWAVEQKSTRQYVGELGFADFKRDIDLEMRGVPELGWAFAPAFHGIGYASEAVGAAVAWGDRHFQSARTVCLIDPRNAASIRVAEKCGYVCFKETELNGKPIKFFERWSPAKGGLVDV